MSFPSPGLLQLTLARFREFYREPAAVFWVYGFPLLMAITLGIAFRERDPERIRIELVETPETVERIQKLKAILDTNDKLAITISNDDSWKKKLSSGKTDLVVMADTSPSSGREYIIWDEPHRSECNVARSAFESTLLHAANPNRPNTIQEEHLKEVGSRYIDFLIPGMVGMNLMGGGLFGVGFVIVDMRVRKLLKRYTATPMKRSDFMLSVMISRLLFTIPEVTILLLFGNLVFDVRVQGSIFALAAVILLGGVCFAGVGLLVACRAKTIETASGLMNLVMLPMYVVSGVFFSSERFPDEMQPFIKALPLTALNDAMRKIMLEGQSLLAVWSQLLILLAWGGISFTIALRYFRWR
jgi:ABC-type multidrug transport system permease subunit